MGVGKSTLLFELKKLIEELGLTDQVDFFEEPIQKWINFGENKTDLLQDMYNNAPEAPYNFQLVALLSKIEQLKFTKRINVVERSIGTQKEVFIPQLIEQQSLTPLQQEILKYGMQVLEHIRVPAPHLIIYLKAPVEVALERLRKRNRTGENTITVSYLQALQERHEKWLEEISNNSETKVWIINAQLPLNPKKLVKDVLDLLCSSP